MEEGLRTVRPTDLLSLFLQQKEVRGGEPQWADLPLIDDFLVLKNMKE